MMLVLVAAGGALAGVGMGVAAWALLGGRRLALRRPGRRAAHLLLAVGAGVGVTVATTWPVGGVIAAAGVWWLPACLFPERATERAIARIESVAAWTEMLRDMLAGASGLHSAIVATVPIAPEAIRGEVGELARHLGEGVDAEQALTGWAQRVDTPVADLVAASLSTAARGHAADVGGVLGRLAEAARERAHMLARVAASRSRVRTSVRIIAATTVVMAVGLVVLNREFVAPLDTLAGQVVLALVGAIWAGSLVWLHRLGRPEVGPRLLHPAQVREVTA